MLTLEMAIQKIRDFPPEQQHQVIEFIERLELRSHKRPLDLNNNKGAQKSFAEAAQEFIGCLDSEIEDLSHNPEYLEGFGG
ncbi:hypothetical protein PN466_00170 [Roseofilum reptotaenium CS-1145]|uniref:DUF2281 domain-containing protein n=1 Tax=Roseofilum reptotaenium AO1-A TaxID=1925591 RepID=A0A1L9QRJ3_9CYAN|nr:MULTISPECIES: hypothetical protein [Roseofilum]MBP0030646.1 hypothetical protein [Roseofilum sp. Guam]MDB9515380.1 hypothetical protein [Roseofilum reptotaenium CS-1145]OJJ25252.1 hypothetical protein BI308_12260 [Roseofilum reptotaenium AO1-A]